MREFFHRKRWFVFVLLGFSTLLLWQFRFVRVSPNLVDARVCQDLSLWTGVPNDPSIAKADDNGLTLTKRNPGRTVSIVQSLPRIDGVRFLSVSMDAAWESAIPAYPINWSMPRVVLFGTDAQGRFSGPLDHGILGARGTRDWHRVQSVVDLPPELQQVRISVDAYGQEGILRINHLRVEAVRQRSWFQTATTLLLCAWLAWCSQMIVPWISGRYALARALAVGVGLLLGFWHFVFPQDRTLFKPILAEFFMGDEIPMAQVTALPSNIAATPPQVTTLPLPPVASTPPPNTRVPRIRTITPPQQVPAPKPVVAAQPVAPIPPVVVKQTETRQSLSLVMWLRSLDRKWYVGKYNLTHFTAFFGIGLYVFSLCGSSRIWPLPVMIAILGEVIPNALFDIWDSGDWWDVASNLLGLTLAFLLVKWLKARWSALMRRRSTIADPSHPPVASGDA